MNVYLKENKSGLSFDYCPLCGSLSATLPVLWPFDVETGRPVCANCFTTRFPKQHQEWKIRATGIYDPICQ